MAKIPAGPSRTITLTYKPTNNPTTVNTKIAETVTAGITLHITPNKTTPAGTVHGPIPTHGTNLELEVWYHHHWITMHAPKTQTNGHYTLKYQFQGATGKFPFRTKTTGKQPNFPYTPAHSKSVTVLTR